MPVDVNDVCSSEIEASQQILNAGKEIVQIFVKFSPQIGWGGGGFHGVPLRALEKSPTSGSKLGKWRLKIGFDADSYFIFYNTPSFTD